MHLPTTSKFILTLISLANLATVALSRDSDKNSDKRAINGTFRKVDSQYRAAVVEGIYFFTEAPLLESISKLPLPALSDSNVTLPIFNTTVVLKLPFAVERSLGVIARRLYLADPMGFRMRVRRRAERRERYRDLVDFDNESDESSTSNSATTTISSSLQERINKVLSSVDSRLSQVATRTDEREAYATSVMKSLISDAIVSNFPATTTSSSAAVGSGSLTYETMTTSYAALGGVEAFVTSYLVLQAVASGSASSATTTSSGTTSSVTGSASIRSSGTTSPSAATTTGGAGVFDLKAAATLGLVGLVIQAVL